MWETSSYRKWLLKKKEVQVLITFISCNAILDMYYHNRELVVVLNRQPLIEIILHS